MEKIVNYNWYNDKYVSKSNPIFIGGSPRSGTTLLRVMLESHKNIFIGPETGLLYTNILNKTKLRNVANQLEISPEAIWSLKKESTSKTQFIDGLFSYILQDIEKNRWGEKSPRNVSVIGDLFTHFPESRFIHIIRDGRDVACSLRKFPKHKIVNGKIIKLDTNNPIDSCISTWVKNVELGIKWRNDPRYLEIKYETLVFNPEHTMRNVLNFVDEPWDENVLRYYLIESSSRGIDKIPQNLRARKPIDKSALARWKHDLSKDEQTLFKKMAGDLLVKLEYETSQDW